MENVKAEKAPKHIQLHDAIQALDQVCYRLDELAAWIEGGDSTPRTEQPETPPSLLDVLNGGADAIREKIESMHKRIDQLHTCLY